MRDDKVSWAELLKPQLRSIVFMDGSKVTASFRWELRYGDFWVLGETPADAVRQFDLCFIDAARYESVLHDYSTYRGAIRYCDIDPRSESRRETTS